MSRRKGQSNYFQLQTYYQLIFINPGRKLTRISGQRVNQIEAVLFNSDIKWNNISGKKYKYLLYMQFVKYTNKYLCIIITWSRIKRQFPIFDRIVTILCPESRSIFYQGYSVTKVGCN